MKKKICVVVTARPSYSRVRSVLEALRNHEDVELQIVAAASFVANKFGEAVKVLREDGFEPNWTINTLLEADTASTAAKSTGLQTIEMASAFQNLKPDMVLTVADRYETISTAIAASYANIPLVHLRGGEVTGNIDEKVRHAITKMSDFHFVSSALYKKRLIQIGENEKNIFNVGALCNDNINMLKTLNKKDLEKNLKTNFYDRNILVSLHPNTQSKKKI